MKTLTDDEHYIKQRNILEQWLNDKVPALIERLEQGYKIKASKTEFFDKDKKEIYSIIENDLKIRCFIEVSEYGSLWLRADVTSKRGKFGCHYIERGLFIGSHVNNEQVPTFKPYRKITLTQYKAAQTRLRVQLDKAQELNNSIGQLKRFIDD